MRCEHCGYPINPGAANHPDCVSKRIEELTQFGRDMAGVIGVALPMGDDMRSEALNRARVVLWPRMWRYGDDGKTAIPIGKAG